MSFFKKTGAGIFYRVNFLQNDVTLDYNFRWHKQITVYKRTFVKAKPL